MKKNKAFIIFIGVLIVASIIILTVISINDKKAENEISESQTQVESTVQTTAETTTETTTETQIEFDWDDMPETNPNASNDYEYSVTMEKDNSIQVIGVGNSDLYSGYIPNIAWNNYGFTNAIIAYANITAPQAFAHLRQVLDVQSPKVVFIEVAMMYEGIGYVGSATVDESRETTEQPEVETNLSLLEQRTITHGYKFSSKSVKLINNQYAFKTDEIDTPPQENVDYLNKMITLCKIKNIKPVLVYYPSIVYWNYARHNAFVEIAEENNIEFIDMNLLLDDIGFDVANDFRDAGNHLNYYGAKPCTEYLANRLVKKYGLKDNRNNPTFSYWNDNYKEYEELVANV